MTFYVSSRGGANSIEKMDGGPWPDKTRWIRQWTREGKEKQRKTKKDLENNAREDLREKNIDLTRIGKATRNREVWRGLVRASSSAC